MSIEARSIVAGYEQTILDGVSVIAQKSRVTCILGPNGAGKSTLLKVIDGFLKPKQGTVLYNGRDVTGTDPSRLFVDGVSYIPQERSIFPFMTVEENLRLGTWSIRKDRNQVKDAVERIYAEFPNLAKRKEVLASRLSAGEQKMLELARALVVKKEVLLVDEPSAGLAPIFAKMIYGELEKLRNRETTIILVDQNVRQAIALSDYVYILESGGNKYEGTNQDIERDLKEIVKDWLRF